MASKDGIFPMRQAVYFALPVVASGYMFCLVSLYAMKFATDVLLIAPAVMGVIFGLSRFWDAISDPLVGYLSDRTPGRMGRRRPWILAAIPLVCVSFWMVFSPPQALSMQALVVWMTVGILLFYTGQTLMVIPHLSLGAELTQQQTARARIFGARHAGWIAGYIAALGTLFLLLRAEAQSDAAARAVASSQSLYMALATIMCFGICVLMLRERSEYQGRGGRRIFGIARDVWRNIHARVVLIVHFIQELGMATITVLTVYMAEYVLLRPGLAPLFIFAFLVWSFLLVPLWLALARRWGKKQIWILASIGSAVAFGGMVFLEPGDEIFLIVLAAFAGMANGAGGVIAPAVLSDVIDYDEHETGERKEGAYSAAWYFTQKFAFAVMLVVTGFALEWAGFVPNQAQNITVIWTMKLLFGGLAAVMFLLSIVLLIRFRFVEAEHEKILHKLQPQS